MKNIFYLFILIVFASCEDVVNVDLETSNPKLVIDANILWQKGTTGNEQKIKLSTTTNYYTNTIPTVSGATVFITNSENIVYDFIEVPNTGEYVCTNFAPIVNETYTLTVQHNGNTYKSTEKLLPTPTIESAEQETVNVFGTDVIQVKFYFQDDLLVENYYLGTIKNSLYVIPELGAFDDRFFEGNQMFGFYSDEDLVAGNTVKFNLQGISLRYYNYMIKLINIAGSGDGNPFATPPATLRGNIINQNDESNYPLGYFSLGEIDNEEYIVQ